MIGIMTMQVADECPPGDGVEATPAYVLADDYWEGLELPTLTPTVPPGHAITGLPAYLVTDTPLSIEQSFETPLGLIEVDARSHFTVDWGEFPGAETGPHEFSGDPYPNGRIAWTYTNRGAYTITVTQHWHGTWRWGPDGGDLEPRQVTATIPDYPVREIQAVIDR